MSKNSPECEYFSSKVKECERLMTISHVVFGLSAIIGMMAIFNSASTILIQVCTSLAAASLVYGVAKSDERGEWLHLKLSPTKRYMALSGQDIRYEGFDCGTNIAIIDKKQNIETHMAAVIEASENLRLGDPEIWNDIYDCSAQLGKVPKRNGVTS